MSDAAVDLVLRTTLTSPFGRKVRIAAEVVGLGERIRIVPADTGDPADSLRLQNPLGKVPCLVSPQNEPIYDSRVALEYLQYLAGSQQLVPEAGAERYAALTRMALADGIVDAGALIIYERRYHDDDQRSPTWLDYQAGKIHRALTAFAAAPPKTGVTDGVAIGLSCALGFLDKRAIVDWRAEFTPLIDWLAMFTERVPAFESTRPPSQ